MRSILILVALGAGLPAAADTIVLTDGTELEGTVLWRRDGKLSLQLEDGSSRLLDEAQVREVVPVAAVLSEFERRRAALPTRAGRERGEALLALGLWAAPKKALAAEAREALAEAGRSDPELQDVVDYHLVRLAIEGERFDEARSLARAILERNPNHERVKELLAEAPGRIVASLGGRLDPLLDAYGKQRYEQVLVEARKLVAGSTPDELAAMSSELESKAGVSLAKVLVDARFRRTCRAARCENGMVQCPYCQGEGRVKRFRRQQGGDFGKARNQPIVYEWCGHCDGRIRYPCPTCKGTGLDLGDPMEVEKEEMVGTLLRIVDENSATFQKLVEAVRDGQDRKIRAIDSYAILSMGRQAIYFLEKAVEIHPPLGSPAGQNLFGKVRQIRELLNTFLSGLSTSYMEEADRLYQEAVDVEVGGAQGGRISNIPSRVLKLQESQALAEESRKYIVELIESDPAAKGFLQGNYQRRLELIDAFIERNRKALVVMKNAENAPDKFFDVFQGLRPATGDGGSAR